MGAWYRIAYTFGVSESAKPIHEDALESESELDPALRAEVRRRAAEVDEGKTPLVDGEKVLAGLRKLINDRG